MRCSRAITTFATIAATLGAVLAATPAESATRYAGRDNANVGLVAHYVPTAAAPRHGSQGDGNRLNLVCKVRNVSVGGNDLWYLVRGSKRRLVSARYVDNLGTAPRFSGDDRPAQPA